MKICFAHNVFNRIEILKETITKERYYYPESEIYISYNGPDPQLEYENIICKSFGDNEGHKLGALNGMISAIKMACESDSDIIFFSHDDVYINDIDLFKRCLNVFNKEYDLLVRRYTELKDLRYFMFDHFAIRTTVARNIFENLNFEHRLPVDCRSSECPEIFFGQLMKNNINMKNIFIVDFLHSSWNDTEFGWFHIPSNNEPSSWKWNKILKVNYDMNKWEDFYNTYYDALNSLYNVNENTLKSIYDEDYLPGHPTTPGGSAWESELKALYSAIRLSKPQRILEIGNWIGISTNHILLAVENNGIGKVTLVDIEENLEYKNLLNNNFNRNIIDSIKFLENELDFDFIAQDGCHEYEHVKKELELITSNTICNIDIWAHDYFVPPKKHVNVKQAWDEMKNHFNLIFTCKDSISDCGIVLSRYIKTEGI